MYMSGAYNVLFLPELLSNRLQTLAQWYLCFGQVCYDFSKSYVMFFGICSGFSGSLCWSMLAHWCTCRKKPMNESWLVNIRAHCQRPHTACTLWAPSTFNQLKYRGLYPILFQCGASVAEGCSALNQHGVFDTNSGTFQMLQINIELTVVNASNTKHRRNVVLMFDQRRRQWYSIKPLKKSESRNLKF